MVINICISTIIAIAIFINKFIDRKPRCTDAYFYEKLCPKFYSNLYRVCLNEMLKVNENVKSLMKLIKEN